jgi:Uma2 family endonuclease
MDSTRAEALQTPLTHRDLDDTPDDGNRWEVIDGELHVSPFPTPAHQRAVTKLVKALASFVDERGLGEVFAPGFEGRARRAHRGRT